MGRSYITAECSMDTEDFREALTYDILWIQTVP
jgi:hypothetical protein